MKQKLFSFLLLSLMFIGLSSMKSPEEEMLLGEWNGSITNSENGEDPLIIQFVFTFNDSNASVQMTFQSDELGEFATVVLHGTWSAGNNSINYKFYEDQYEISFGPIIKGLAAMSGTDIQEFEKAMSDSLKKEFASFSEMKIISLSADKLVADFDDDTPLTLYKK